MVVVEHEELIMVGGGGGGGSRALPSLVSLSTKIMLLVIYSNEFIYFLKHTWALTRQRSEVRVMAVVMQVMVVVAAGRCCR